MSLNLRTNFIYVTLTISRCLGHFYNSEKKISFLTKVICHFVSYSYSTHYVDTQHSLDPTVVSLNDCKTENGTQSVSPKYWT